MEFVDEFLLFRRRIQQNMIKIRLSESKPRCQ